MTPSQCLASLLVLGLNTLMACSTVALSKPTKEPTSRSMQSVSRDFQTAGALPTISVEILGGVADLRGHTWPHRHDPVYDKVDQPVRTTTAGEPHELVVVLPSGRTLRHISKATIFGQRKGIVTDAEFLPHPGQLHFSRCNRAAGTDSRKVGRGTG